MRFSTPYRWKEKKVETENKSVACAGKSFEGQADSGSKGKITQEQRDPMPQSPATQAP